MNLKTSTTKTKKQPSLKTAREYYARAREHFRADKLKDAEADYTNAILQNKQFTEAWVFRGDVYAKTEKHGLAIENFEEAFRLVSADNQLRPGEGSKHKAIILSRIAAVKLAQGKYDDAIRFSARSAKLMQNYTTGEDLAKPRYIQGMAWLKKGGDDQALYYFTCAAAEHTRDAYYINSLLERARILRKLARARQAINDCNEILRLNPDHPEALVERANSRSEEAYEWSNEDIEDLRKAVRISPGHPEALFALADCLFGIGRLEEAGEIAAKALALELNSDNQETAVRLRNIMGEANKTKVVREKALANYHAFVRSYPGVKISSHRKNAQVKQEEFDKAIAETSRVLLANPGDVATLSKRAAAWIGRGNLEKAREDLDRLVELQPDNPDFLNMQELVEFF
ncbi:MAG: tetratricopeptide repeat protein [Hyphomicrobiales bacterium]|nr:tetratricopeptide repeat protein [Hyphomicrobiales bacterium]